MIRLQAIEALYRLQDPADPQDSLISEFIQLMHDTQAKVYLLVYFFKVFFKYIIL